MMYGYARVSSKDQCEDRQIISLLEAGVERENIFIDKASGKDYNRSAYQELMEKLNENSVLVVSSIDRLGRNYDELTEQWRMITKVKKSDICVLDMPLLDTRREKDLLGTLISDLVLNLFGYIAEKERTDIKRRQAEGIAAAKARGVRFGRPPMALTDAFKDVHARWRAGEMYASEAAKLCNMSKTSFLYFSKVFENGRK